jgi:DDE superfamily endonuclease
LILDSFHVHRCQAVKNEITHKGIGCLLIPGGLTSELQPLDIGINGPFKHWLREYYINNPGFDRLSASEKRFQIACGVSKGWNQITSNTIIRSFGRILSTTFSNIEEANEIQ